MEKIQDSETAIQLAKEYASEECVGKFGKAHEVSQDGYTWIVEFNTHTFDDEYKHRIRINQVGNVFSHERGNRLE